MPHCKTILKLKKGIAVCSVAMETRHALPFKRTIIIHAVIKADFFGL
jgi:hypothetical protein